MSQQLATPVSPAVSTRPPTRKAAAQQCLTAAVQWLRAEQQPDGWWKGNLETNVTMDAEDLLLRKFLGILDPADAQASARSIASRQRGDGSWSLFPGADGDLSTTVEAWVALRLAGHDPRAEHMRRAARFAREAGGVPATRVFTRIWLALFGLWDWNRLPTLPPELIYLPRWFPLNIYDFGCWARQTVVPLTIVCTLRPVVDIGFDVTELTPEAGEAPAPPNDAWSRLFRGLDGLLARHARRRLHPLRGNAMRTATEWILRRQESDGSWGGIQPPWVYSILALYLMGYPLDHPSVAAGLAGLEGFTIREQTPEGQHRWIEACQSPVWDTGLALIAMLDAGAAAGVHPNDPAVRSAARWLLAEEIRVPGDWTQRRDGVVPSGWAFEFANDNYPDTDDTAEIVMGLDRVAPDTDTRCGPALQRATDWLLAMQSRDGGWGAFDADNTTSLPGKLPFCDFGEVTDPPSADVTGHIVEMLAARGLAEHPATRRGVAWLLRHQEADGSYFGRWGANYIYGTAAVLPALLAAGLPADHPGIRRASRWLAEHQNADGGWGEDLRSYDDPRQAGIGASTPSQTAWALLALLAAGDHGAAVEAGVAWLAEHQNADGSWDEDHYTGTGFPGDFYIGYRLYRMVFPVMALGRYVAGVRVPGLEAGDSR